LLNIGPRPDGTVPPEAEERLREIGKWLETYGGSIYGTRAGPVPARSWGVTTRRGDTVFVHVLDWKDPVLALPLAGKWKAKLWPGGASVAITRSGESLALQLPSSDVPDRVIALTH
jgi:alpha-L-fucosidase